MPSRKRCGRLPEPAYSNGRQIPAPEGTVNWDSKCPVVTFEFAVKGWDVDNCDDQKDRSAVAKKISSISKQTWRELRNQGGNKGGYKEEPPMQDRVPHPFKGQMPIAFRLQNRKPIIGIRDRGTFYALWIDHKMNLYDHG